MKNYRCFVSETRILYCIVGSWRREDGGFDFLEIKVSYIYHDL